MSASPLGEVVGLFLRLGATAFGGPAAHVAMLRHEVVTRRHWLSDQEFVDLLGATNLIPGPNSTEMAIHIGYRRAGWPGLIAGGVCFALPATVIVMALAWVYVTYGTTPQATGLLYGIKPVILAVILSAIWGLRRVALKGRLGAVIAATVLVAYLLRVNELVLLFGGALSFAAIRRMRRPAPGGPLAGLAMPLAGLPAAAYAWLSALPLAAIEPFNLGRMFLLFLKIGAVLYGSGYVLLAFMRNDLVVRLGWLTDRQLLDAISIGQFTPGPLFTTATFVGYLLGGIPAALLATLGIFAPSFIFVAVSHPFVARMRASPWAGPLLDGVNASALGLMAAITFELGRAALIDLPTVVLFAVAAVVLLRTRLNSAWLVLGGGLAGLALSALAG